MRVNKVNLIHVVLGHSYLFSFFGLLVGLFIDVFWKYRLDGSTFTSVGLIFLMVGSILIFWAQNTSRKTKNIRHGKEVTHDNFFVGPYIFTRSPTHMGIAIMMLGLGLVMNSASIVITALLSYLITRYLFVQEEERLLARKYGDAYRIYKKKVPL